jgi:serpin (serine protease inhibitor)
MAGVRAWFSGLFGAKDERLSDTSLPEPHWRIEKLRSFAADHNDFALALYGQLRQRPGNLFFSPFSIRTTLAMTYTGARGVTAAQMGKAVRFSSSDEIVHEAFGELALGPGWGAAPG